MRKLILSSLILLLLFTASLAGQEVTAPAPPNGYGGQFFVGTRGLDNSNYLGQVSEYDTARQGLRPSVGLDFWTQRGSTFFDMGGIYRGDAKDQQYRLDLQVDRNIRVRSYFLKFLHRLDHDPLTDLDTAKGGPMVQHTDYDPNGVYQPGYTEMGTEIEITVPGAEWLRLRGSHRSYLRDGGVQMRAMSKCSTCHVTGSRKEIDQRSHEIGGGLSIRTRKASIDYDYYNRQFNERGPTLMMAFDRAVHPVSEAPVFEDRVQFDSLDGLLPVGVTPDSRKQRHAIRARVELPKETRLQGAFTTSSLKNKFSGVGADSWGWNTRYTIPIGDTMAFSIRARQLDWEVDDYFVDVTERVVPGGPNAGNTYVESYPEFGEPDFLRLSARSRNDVSVRGEFSARIAKYTNLRAGYQYRHRERDNYEVETTNTSSVYANFRKRLRKTDSGDWSMRLRYRMDKSDHPFLHHRAANPPALQPFQSPGNVPFTGTQYFTIYDARTFDLSNFPAWSHFVEPTLTWMPSTKMSASFHYRYRSQSNHDLGNSEWDRTVHMPGAEVWVAPNEKVDFTLAYTFDNQRSNSLFDIAVYDG